MTTEERKAWHKQCAAIMKRELTLLQYELAYDMIDHDLSDSEILITLERKYFLNRKQSTAILDKAWADYEKIAAA